MNSEDKNGKLASFTWAALVALKLAVQDGKISSALSEHLFMMNWLSVARKRKLFSKQVAPEIQWLLTEGRNKGVNANLKLKVEYLYFTSQETTSEQSAYFRFTHAIEELGTHGWDSYFLTSRKWDLLNQGEFGLSGNFIFMEGERVQGCFDRNGKLHRELPLRVCGDVDMAERFFTDNKIVIDIQRDANGERVYFLLSPEKN
ncbi:TPA: DUF2913 family protein [Salmonella enterica]